VSLRPGLVKRCAESHVNFHLGKDNSAQVGPTAHRTSCAHSSGARVPASSFSRIFSGVASQLVQLVLTSSPPTHTTHLYPSMTAAPKPRCHILQNPDSLNHLSWVSTTYRTDVPRVSASQGHTALVQEILCTKLDQAKNWAQSLEKPKTYVEDVNLVFHHCQTGQFVNIAKWHSWDIFTQFHERSIRF
jgi:hypothetical protein